VRLLVPGLAETYLLGYTMADGDRTGRQLQFSPLCVVDVNGAQATLREIRGNVGDSDVRKIVAEANANLARLKLEWTRMHP